MSPEEWLESQTKPTTPVLSPEEWAAQSELGTLSGVVDKEKVTPTYQFNPKVAQLGALTGAILGATPLGRAGGLATSMAKGAFGGGR